MSKQYGLILPNKNKYEHQICPVSSTKPSIFEEDSDSDTPSAKPTGVSKGIKKQHKINQNKALEEDPTVFQYDEVYDDMEKKRNESKLARKDLDKKPKYISRLIATAEKRKRENERRIERQVQKEREQEGDLYRDKESFVTSAYKKKLEEMKQLEEQEKYEEYLESIGDVRKQGNLDGFYRHLYDQKVNYEEKNDIKKEVKEEATSETEVINNENSDSENMANSSKDVESQPDSEHISTSTKRKRSNSTTERTLKKDIKQRKYRTRRSSSDSNDEQNEVENVKDKKEHLPSNLDADSDFSIDSSDSEDEKQKATNAEEKNDNKEEIPKEVNEVKSEETATSEVLPEAPEEINVKEEKIQKPKINIWKKRTIGEKFDEAVKRYFERKAQRDMLKSS